MDDGPGYRERVTEAPATWTRTGTWDERDIPPRPWLAKGYFLRGAVTVLVGPSGISKSSLVLAWTLALTFGGRAGRMHAVACYRAAIYNVEDDGDEQERRLSAALRAIGKTPADVAGRIMRTGPTGTGTLFRMDSVRGLEPTAAMLKLERDVVAFGADILFVDPLAELHDAEENDNTNMRAVVAAFRQMAARCNIAVVIVHHTRKGTPTPGDPEIGRGAGAVIGAARVVLTITGMTAEDAAAFGMPAGHERHFFRVDLGKSNYAPRADVEWFERVGYDLENEADDAAAAVPWAPPQDAVGLDVQAKIEAAIRRGSPSGPLSPQLDNKPRSVKAAMIEAGITTAQGQKNMLAKLTTSGFAVVKFKDANRKMVNGLRAPDGYPVAVWEDGDSPDGAPDAAEPTP